MSSEALALPPFESFYFGLYTCAHCLDPVNGRRRIRKVLKEPCFADYAEKDILIPAGRHSFHPECWDQHVLDQQERP